ncbi:MAG: hypothetical protein UZ09_BCD002001275 [Bacteroidetes bacterium OLB9]|nr:MAG: hypothetical protein UZ09_BCD002001275 [Bacteroidetes bacterium OLB9]
MHTSESLEEKSSAYKIGYSAKVMDNNITGIYLKKPHDLCSIVLHIHNCNSGIAIGQGQQNKQSARCRIPVFYRA